MMHLFFNMIFVLSLSFAAVSGARFAGECSQMCNDLRTEVLTLAICRDAKRTLPRPKVGDFCSTAMEQGFSDACVALCMEQEPVARVSQTCRAAAIEMPRPTVRKWCEHGYNEAFKKTMRELRNHFPKEFVEPEPEEIYTSPEVVEERREEPVHHQEAHRHVEPAHTETAPAKKSESSLRGAQTKVDEVNANQAVKATIPITIGDETHDLVVYEGQNAEEAVVVFCREHEPSDVSTCIRQLLNVVIEKLEEA